MDLSIDLDEACGEENDDAPIAGWTLDELEDAIELESLRCAWTRSP